MSTQSYVAEDARIGDDIDIGPGNWIGPGVTILSGTSIGKGNAFLPGVMVGLPSRQRLQRCDRTCPSEEPRVEIGDDNIFFEYCSIHAPMQEVTSIGDGNSIGARCHISHDCRLGDSVIIAANCSLGGYACVQTKANLGLGVDVHPRRVVGEYAMCGAGAVIIRHIYPGAKVAGVPARYIDVNEIGLARAGYDALTIKVWRDAIGSALSAASPKMRPSLDRFTEAINRMNVRVAVLPSPGSPEDG